MAEYDLVIWDLDGTLVDSERMAEGVLARMAAKLPKPISPDAIGHRYRGQTVDFMLADLEKLQGSALPEEFLSSMQTEYENACRTELQVTPHAREALEALRHIPMCVASNSEPETIPFVLECVGLSNYFGDNWFSGKDVPNAKPEPDIFLYAADYMETPARYCIVLEDTPLGVQAALAAEMTVVGFAGNHPESLGAMLALGVPVITDMQDFPPIVLGTR